MADKTDTELAPGELDARQAVIDALEPLDQEARERVLRYLNARFGNPDA